MWLPTPLEVIWNFFSNPKNLEQITPHWCGLSIESSGPCVKGTRLSFRLNPLGLPLNIEWVSCLQDVVDVGDKRQFVDLQEKGLFSHWKHTHRFEAGTELLAGERSGAKVRAKEPGTWLYDQIDYALPNFPAAHLAKPFVEKSLAKMLSSRRKELQKIFMGP